MLADEINQFVGVLHRRRNAYGAGPVVVHVRQLVRQLLDARGVQRQSWSLAVQNLFENDEVSGRHCALVDGLGNEEEVLVLVPRHGVIQHRARRGVVEFVL